MSSEVFRAGLALRARTLGRAVRCASTVRTVIHPEAIGIAAMAMAGERTGLWGVSLGKLRRGVPKIYIVGDAREHHEQAQLWAQMAPIIESAGDEPQLVLPNRQCAKLLTESASRFRYNSDPVVAAAAETVWWCITRREMAGSHSSVVLTDALAEQYAIGEDGGSTDDLRIALAWIGSVDAEDLDACRQANLEQFSDPKTSLEFDEDLWPNVERRDAERQARRSLFGENVSEQQKERARRDIELQARNRATIVKRALNKPLKQAWERLRAGAAILESEPLPHLPDLEKFCEADRSSWQRELSRRERGYAMARRDSTRAAVIGLAEAEVAAELWEAALVWGDSMARAEALADGTIASGVVQNSGHDGLTVVVDSGTVRARFGDERVLVIDGDEIAVEVVDVITEAENISVVVEWKGMNAVADGTSVALWPPRPDFGRRYLGWLAGRISSKHWVLGDTDGTPPPVRRASNDQVDPLARALALRNS